MIKFLFLIFSVLWMNLSFSSPRIVNIAAHNYPPFYDGEGNGFASEIFKAAFNEVNVKVKVTSYPIKRSIQVFFSGKALALAPGAAFLNEEQREKSVTVNSFGVVAAVFFKKNSIRHSLKDSFQIQDLKPYKVGTILNSPTIPLFQSHGIEYFTGNTNEQLFRLLEIGRIDLVEIGLISGLLMLDSGQRQSTYFSKGRIVYGGLAFLKNKESIKLKNLYEKGLSKITKNGKLKKILEDVWGNGNIPLESLVKNQKHLGSKSFSIEKFNKSNMPKKKALRNSNLP